MQDTRLNRLFDATADRLGGWLNNPWRRSSVLLISLLLGFFLASAVITIEGQRASLDVVVAATLVLITELINRLVYRGRRSFSWQLLNALKLGLTYGLFLDALKLGS
jgi:hypothetical protein